VKELKRALPNLRVIRSPSNRPPIAPDASPDVGTSKPLRCPQTSPAASTCNPRLS
jgi:hypothetical protein